mmetsp:Transcript_45403/g.83007  ORF Transcript_45403/g.83007 Transcript_45403/m.83007 type:complete len:108 (+) Transcript_45403:492-815(+)
MGVYRHRKVVVLHTVVVVAHKAVVEAVRMGLIAVAAAHMESGRMGKVVEVVESDCTWMSGLSFAAHRVVPSVAGVAAGHMGRSAVHRVVKDTVRSEDFHIAAQRWVS